MGTDGIPRREYEWTDGWYFALNSREEQAFRPVSLPHDWAVGQPFDRNMEEGRSQGFRNRYGIGWYRKDAVLPEKRNGKVYLLSFGGIYENSTVRVNGHYVGGRKYGYSSFTLDVTDFLKEKICLRLKCAWKRRTEESVIRSICPAPSASVLTETENLLLQSSRRERHTGRLMWKAFRFIPEL